MFKAIVCRKAKCKDCDEYEHGIFERLDCGCVFEVEIGTYDTLNKARFAAMAASKAKGRGIHRGICTGDWSVETADGIVDAGRTEKVAK